jgi:hypothetical protein
VGGANPNEWCHQGPGRKGAGHVCRPGERSGPARSPPRPGQTYKGGSPSPRVRGSRATLEQGQRSGSRACGHRYCVAGTNLGGDSNGGCVFAPPRSSKAARIPHAPEEQQQTLEYQLRNRRNERFTSSQKVTTTEMFYPDRSAISLGERTHTRGGSGDSPRTTDDGL